MLEHNCQPIHVRVKCVKVWEYVGVGDDDIRGLTLYILYGMYNEDRPRKNKPSEQ